jgi:hypothetical protein
VYMMFGIGEMAKYLILEPSHLPIKLNLVTTFRL